VQILFNPSKKRADGGIVVNGKQVASTQQCVHCGSHEVIIPGSKRKRGLCRICKGFVCGRKECMEHCVPFERKLDYSEAKGAGLTKEIEKLEKRYPSIKTII
jgi:hypothetical protein